MNDNDSKGISYTAGFFMLIAFAVAGLVLAELLSKPIWLEMTGNKAELFVSRTFSPEDSSALKIIQAISVFIGLFIPAILTAFVLNRKPIKLLGFSTQGIKLSQVGLVILLLGASLLVSTSLSYLTTILPLPASWRTWFDKLEDIYNTQVSVIVNLKDGKDYILSLIIMAFVPALCEEAFFRGGLQNFLTRGTGKPWLSIIVVSALFSLVHFSGYGFLSRFFLGIVLGALFHYSGKLWLSILAHFINNALAITVLYISIQQGKSLQEAIKQDAGSFWGILGVPVVIGLFYLFKNISPRRQIV
jgi:membrane protease YdiL (CAAX protease family)